MPNEVICDEQLVGLKPTSCSWFIEICQKKAAADESGLLLFKIAYSKLLGIGLITFNRSDRLAKVLEQIRKHTKHPYQLVVADDGSTDNTRMICETFSAKIISGENKGVCWNKNRALFSLHLLGCDPILLIEDDCYPIVDDWADNWIKATALWDHISYAHPKIKGDSLGGTGTPSDPFLNQKATAQCTSISSRALSKVGFLSTRFKGYGVGHAEWTSRLKSNGFGHKQMVIDGKKARVNLYIESGLFAEDAPSNRDNLQVAANRDIFKELKADPSWARVFVYPWLDFDEAMIFLKEQGYAGAATSFY